MTRTWKDLEGPNTSIATCSEAKVSGSKSNVTYNILTESGGTTKRGRKGLVLRSRV